MLFLRTIPGAVSLGLIWGVMAIGLYISYKILDFADLTVDGSICCGAVVCTVLINAGVNVAVAMLVAFVAGVLCGLMTGLFNTLFGIPPILAGILSQLALWSINLKILGIAHQSIDSNAHKLIVLQLNQLQTILVMLAIVVTLIALLYCFFGTRRGCSIRATGCNEKMARAQGINVAVNKNIGLMLSNGIVALSGALLCQYQGSADINMGRGAIVTGLAAVIIGLAIVSWLPDNFAIKLVGVVVGAVVYFMVYQFIVNLGFDTDLLKLLSALLVALFLAIPNFKKMLSRYGKRGERTGRLKPQRATVDSGEGEEGNDD